MPNSMSSRSIARWGAVLAAPVLAVSAGLSPASATSTYTVPLHQAKDLPITATGFTSHEAKCGSIPASQDGWHFVLTGNSTDFVKLTVTFQSGGQVVVTSFGPPTNKHAYVASAPGATLVAASAEVVGGGVEWFNLSHTCPASEKPPTTQPPTTQPPTTQPPTTAPPATTKPPTTPPATGGTKTPPPGETPSGTPSASESATVSPTSSPSASTGGSSGGGGGSLAQTGGIAVGGILAVSAAMVAGGYYIRRRAAGGNAAS
ncbi:LPXTG cell wall anchor domain-containing protein [Uniformispora flossi]|uniref:LPXTG cell wall anchor domain-containing protein n=1 Tax=Uniformispora flossi TaxID=3390723 RepID=UPI003C2EE660